MQLRRYYVANFPLLPLSLGKPIVKYIVTENTRNILVFGFRGAFAVIQNIIYSCCCCCCCCCCCVVASVVYDSVRPHGWQPTRLPHPWNSPGKNTGVGCHLLLQCRKVKVKSPSRVQLLATPWTTAYQAPPSMGFSRQEPLPSLTIYS